MSTMKPRADAISSRDLNREAVGVVQGERLLAGKHRALELGKLVFQIRLALAKRGAETFLLRYDQTTLELAVLDDLGGTHRP